MARQAGSGVVLRGVGGGSDVPEGRTRQRTKSRMRCSTPYCRTVIALDKPAHRMVIDRLVAQATEIDALLVTLERSS